jgi:RNA polymerase sigma factor (sigma-70 family)
MADGPELLRQFAERADQRAFAEVLRTHVNLVYSVALRQVAGDAHLAEDVTQQVFVALARKAPEVSRRPSLSGWLCVAASLAAAAAVRGEQRRRRRESAIASEIQSVTPHPSTSAMPSDPWEAARPALDQAIADLTPNEREAVLLRFFENHPFAEIGRRLRVSEDGARMRVERALRKLGSKLNRRGIKSSAAALGELIAQNAASAAPAHLAAPANAAAIVAAASSGLGVASGILTFMSTTKAPLIFAIFAAACASWFAVQELMVRRQAESELNALTAGNRLLSNQLEQLGNQARRLTASPNEKNAGLGTSVAAKANSAAMTSDLINRNPQVHEAVGELVDWNNDQFFAPLLRARGLSNEQVLRAEYLIGQLEQFGFGASMLSFKTDPRTDAEINAEFAQLVGASFGQIMAEYLVDRWVISKLAGGMAAVEPLTVQQGSQLSQIWVSALHNSGAPPTAAQFPEISAQAQSVLTPGQYAALRELVGGDSGEDLIQ